MAVPVTPEQVAALLAAARAALVHAYAPYSGFRVGAALLCEKDSVVTGVNVENSSYGLTVCAERVAVFSAVAAGKRGFSAIAVVAGDRSAVTPCGACRQVLHEFSPDLLVILDAPAGPEIVPLTELLPRAFRLEHDGESA